MNPKYIVVCGPAISVDDIDDPLYRERLYFPEAQYGGDGVINRVDQVIKQGFPVIIYTRYFHVLQAFGEAVADGRVKCEDLSIVLHEEVVGEILITKHTMNPEGFMSEGWHFGILS